MFYDAEAFNQDIGNWNVGNVENMSAMFAEAKSFDGNVERWCGKTANVTDMGRMFKNAAAFSGHDLSCWDVSKVTDHHDFGTGWGSGNVEPNWR